MRTEITATAILGALLLAGCGGPPPAGAPRPSASATGGPSAACSPTTHLDRFSDELNKTEFQGRFVGNLSGLALPPDGTVLALSDRSLLFTLDGRSLRPTAVQPLTDADGSALDSEAVVLDADGTRLITSETEPSVGRYPVGSTTPTEELPVPPDLRVAPPGRASKNQTFEGLTRAGDVLTAAMERPLNGDQDNLVRFQTWTRVGGHFGLAAQYGYRVDSAAGVSELAALGDGRLLVLERGYLPGIGNTVRLYVADPRRASNVAAITNLTDGPGGTLVGKTLVADLVHCPSLGATNGETQSNPLLDNVEGMTVLSRQPDGTTRLLLVSDDNASRKQTTRLYWLTARIS